MFQDFEYQDFDWSRFNTLNSDFEGYKVMNFKILEVPRSLTRDFGCSKILNINILKAVSISWIQDFESSKVVNFKNLEVPRSWIRGFKSRSNILNSGFWKSQDLELVILDVPKLGISRFLKALPMSWIQDFECFKVVNFKIMEVPRSLTSGFKCSKILNINILKAVPISWIQDFEGSKVVNFKNLEIPRPWVRDFESHSNVLNSGFWKSQDLELVILDVPRLGILRFLKAVPMSWIQGFECFKVVNLWFCQFQSWKPFQHLRFKILEVPRSRTNDFGCSKVVNFMIMEISRCWV